MAMRRLYKAKSGKTISERLQYYSLRVGECIIWQGVKNKKGYGSLNVHGKQLLVHRIVWMEKNGPIPTDKRILHHCDMPSCLNIDHLFLGTDKDNSDDKIRKGRQCILRGEQHGMAKLTEKDVIAIRADARIHRRIAAEYGVGINAVRKIKYRIAWASIK